MKLDELRHEITALLRCYPRFVTGHADELTAGDLPVFVFHSISVREFEEQLNYLVCNGYHTLGLGEFLETIAGRRKPRPREVLLTFDDARSSFWLRAFPVLKKYDVQATLFAITGWTPRTTARPNLDDVWAGRISQTELDQIDPDDSGVCSWDELARMHASGFVTVDSHSHLHRRVFRSPQLISVIKPGDDFSPSRAVHSPYLSYEESPLSLNRQDFVGLPILPDRSLLDDGPAIRVPIADVQAFQAEARKTLGSGGGRLGVRELARLRTLLPATAMESMSAERIDAEMRQELALARATLREGLDDPEAGRTLCLPYTAGGSAVTRIAGELGLAAMFWGVSVLRKINHPGQDPMQLVRMKNDFIWRLPGEGRRSLPGIYVDKARRRLAGVRPY